MIYGIVMCHIGGKPLCLANEHFSNIPAIRLPLDGSRPCPICYTVKSKQSRKRHSDTRPADMFSWWRVDVVIMKAKSVTGAVSLSYLSINLTCYVIGFPNALRTEHHNNLTSVMTFKLHLRYWELIISIDVTTEKFWIIPAQVIFNWTEN